VKEKGASVMKKKSENGKYFFIQEAYYTTFNIFRGGDGKGSGSVDCLPAVGVQEGCH
jgi:hypothetical protein